MRILQRYNLQDYAAVYAYGNSAEDLAMLDLADHRFMVGTDLHLPELSRRNQSPFANSH